jgi:hypothetical protein
MTAPNEPDFGGDGRPRGGRRAPRSTILSRVAREFGVGVTVDDPSPPTAGRMVLVDNPAGPEHAVPLQRQRESDRSQPGISVILSRKFTMRTRPNWTVTRYLGANDKTIHRFPYPVTVEIPRAGHSGHVSSVDHSVRH